MAPLCFAANLDWLFLEYPTLPQRMEAAAKGGFRAVELCRPYASEASDLKAAAERYGLEVVLINTPPGNQENDNGLGAVPGREFEFREGLALAIQYAKTLNCPRIHLMAGRIPMGAKGGADPSEMEATFIENLRYAANILAQENLIGLLEPINNRISDPRYFLTTPQQAVAILNKVGRPNLKLQLDIFHCQIMDGNLTQNLESYFPIIDDSERECAERHHCPGADAGTGTVMLRFGVKMAAPKPYICTANKSAGHVQIAQVPARHEPDTLGELNFTYLFQLLESIGYSGYVGCEYKPEGVTLKGLSWLYSYWRNHGLSTP